MSSDDYPNPDEFLSVFGTEAKYDSDWLSYGLRFLRDDGFSIFFSFSILTLGISACVEWKVGQIITEATIDNVINIRIDKEKKEIIVKSEVRGYRQELIICPFSEPMMNFVNLSTSGVLEQ